MAIAQEVAGAQSGELHFYVLSLFFFALQALYFPYIHLTFDIALDQSRSTTVILLLHDLTFNFSLPNSVWFSKI